MAEGGAERPRLRLLQIAGFPVLPALAGGKVRIVQLARALCELGVDITIVAPAHVTQTRALAQREPFQLIQVPYPFALPALLTQVPIPYGALVSFHPGYRAMIRARLEDFDVCQIEHPAFVDVAETAPAGLPIVYDAQNVEYDYVCSESTNAAIRRVAGERVRGLEDRLVRRADHVFACSDRDCERLGELYGVREGGASVLANGIDVTAVEERIARRVAAKSIVPARRPQRAIFSGSAVPHNHEGVQALLSRVAPKLRDEAEFVIVGACARRFKGTSLPNVLLDPDGDVARYATPEAVGINPVTQGSGTSLKVLDYLAHGLPVLSTPFGMRGFERLTPFVETAELEAFVDLLRAGLRPPQGVREELRAYEWRKIARDALRVYENLVEQGARDPGRG